MKCGICDFRNFSKSQKLARKETRAHWTLSLRRLKFFYLIDKPFWCDYDLRARVYKYTGNTVLFHKYQSAGFWGLVDPIVKCECNFSVIRLSKYVYNVLLALEGQKILSAKV